MKKSKSVKLWLAIFFAFCMMMMPGNQIKAEAADIIATVQGTVGNETTTDLLYLSTPEGVMQIKIDKGTEISGIRVLLPNSTVKVSVTHGNDGYLHAAKIFMDAATSANNIDTAHAVTVAGTINTKSNGNILYFNTSAGEMQIKLDDTTKINAGTILVLNKTYYITCARGVDAYMHAISIDDQTGTAAANGSAYSATGTAYSPIPAAAVTASTTVVTGTVGSNTKENLLYLMTSGGEMQIVIDANTDSRFGMILTPGRQLTLTVYRGSDAYMHAAMIIGIKTAPAAVQIDTASPVTVTGTVSSKSTEDLLYLNTSQGEMQLKLDAVYNVSNCKVLISGRQVTVTCARGSDAYLHALAIKGN